ncbi:winged helix-turn-helix transcriptional regulator [Dyadobacter subterraneus]
MQYSKDMEAKEELFQERLSHSDCSKSLLPVRDALDALNGKWKLQIIISLMFGNKRFTQIAKEIPNITDKMLSKELRDLEAHELVKRTVYDSIPVVVEYTLTEHGKSLRELIDVLRVWGIKHRNQVMGKAVLVES